MKKITRCGSLKLSNLIKSRVEKTNHEVTKEIGDKETTVLPIPTFKLKEQEHTGESGG